VVTRTQTISEITRRELMDSLTVAEVSWAGRLTEDDPLARLWDLAALPSHDFRFKTASEDIWKHRVVTEDWPEDWVLYDDRFNLLRCDDGQFGRFLSEMALIEVVLAIPPGARTLDSRRAKRDGQRARRDCGREWRRRCPVRRSWHRRRGAMSRWLDSGGGGDYC
jgi:hypothetical protein